MATGEHGWTSEGKKGKKFEFTPVPAGDYEGKLDTSGCAVQKKAEPGKFPFVGIRIEVLNSAMAEGGKNRIVFHNLFTSLKPGRNGDIMPERADQIVGLAHALGEEYKANTIVLQDEDGNDVECLDPKQMVAWLKEHDGAILSLHTKVQAATKDYPAKATVAYFTEVEIENAFGAGETAEEVEEDLAEEEEEVEEEAPPVKAKKTAAKPALKVAGKRR